MTATTSRRPDLAQPVRRPAYTPTPLGSLLALSRAMLRSFFRDRTALFFTFFFPLMFLVVFGLVGGDSGTSGTTIGVVGSGALVQQLPTEALERRTYPSLEA